MDVGLLRQSVDVGVMVLVLFGELAKVLLGDTGEPGRFTDRPT